MIVFVALALLVFPAAAPAAEAHAGKPVMGTVFQVTVEAEDEATARTLADQAVSIASRWDNILTTWREEGELARLNAAAGKGPFLVTGELRTALGRMRRLGEVTEGGFDPTVGALVEAWRVPGARPVAKPAPGFDASVRIERAGVILEPGVRLDAGGIGKGIALDAIARVVVASGASSLWLDFGGSSQLAWSQGRRPRTVAVAGLAKGVVHGTLELGDVALATSRSTGPGAPAGPILDPRSGEPVRAARLATVLCADGTTADAWSTALVVLGRAGLGKVGASGCEALVEDGEGVAVTANFWAAQVTRRR